MTTIRCHTHHAIVKDLPTLWSVFNCMTIIKTVSVFVTTILSYHVIIKINLVVFNVYFLFVQLSFNIMEYEIKPFINYRLDGLLDNIHKYALMSRNHSWYGHSCVATNAKLSLSFWHSLLLRTNLHVVTNVLKVCWKMV